MKLLAAWPAVKVVVAIAWVAVTAVFTVNVKVLEAVAPVESVTVTLKVVAARLTVGLPVIVPVVALTERPAGKAGEML